MIDDLNLHPGRAWPALFLPERIAGRVGEVHLAVIEDLDPRAGRIIVAELAVAGLSWPASTPRVSAPSRQPLVSVTWP